MMDEFESGWCEGRTASGERCAREVYRPNADGRYLCWQHEEIALREARQRFRDRLTADAKKAGLDDGAMRILWAHMFGELAGDLLLRRDVGIVYLMRHDEWTGGSLHKIGITHDPTPEKRRIGLQHSAGMPIELVDHATVNNARRVEIHLHQMFEAKRGFGEWFALDAGDVSVVRAWLAALGFLAGSQEYQAAA